MHEQHPVFEPPTNPDIPIWRYMDLAKFMSMLEEQALHFGRADRMWDKFEGCLSDPLVDFHRDLYGSAFDTMHEQESNARRRIREHTYLNCWCMGEHESVSMWNSYQKGDGIAIAIRSTYRRLAECLDASERERIYIGKVTYLDYKVDEIPWNNWLYPYVHKRKSFEFENELRALFQQEWLTPGGEEGQPRQPLPPGQPVKPVVIELDNLVEGVYVSPRAPTWTRELIKKIMDRYQRNWCVRQSDLDDEGVI
jgi:hypothetical protein